MRTAGPAVIHETKYPALNMDVFFALYARHVPRRESAPTVDNTLEMETLPPPLRLVVVVGTTFIDAWEGEGDGPPDDDTDTDDDILQDINHTVC